MRKIRLLALFATYIVMSLALASCKESAEEVKTPNVTLSEVEASPVSLTFTVEPENAVKCAYLYVTEESELPEAAEIIAEGTEISATEVSTVKISELEPATGYVILAAVSGLDGTVVYDKLVMSTLEDIEGPDKPDPDAPYEMTFSEVVCDNDYADAGEFYIKMKDAAGEHELILDFFAAKDAVSLPAGTYTLGKGEEPLTLNMNMSYLSIKAAGATSGTTVLFTDGTVDVTRDGKTYVLDINLTAENSGKVYKSRFEGEIKDMPVEPSAVVEVIMNAASLHDNADPESGFFLVKLHDSDYAHEMSLHFYAEAGSEVLPAGTYTLGEGTEPGTLGNKSCLDIYNPYSTNYFKSGTVVVTKNGDIYKFEMNLTGRDDDRLFKVMFEGQIDGMGQEQLETVELVAEQASLHFNSAPADGYFYVKMNDKAWKFEMALAFQITPGPASLPSGTYSIEDGTLGEKSYVDIYSASGTVSHKFSSGTVEVAKDGEVYSMTMNLTSSVEPVLLKISFTGTITDMPSDEPEAYSFELDAAKLHDNTDPASGFFLVKLNDSDYAHEMSLHFYAEAGSEVLPAGTYTLGEGTEPGTLGNKSSLDIYNPYSTNYFKSGTVVVTKNGDIYKFEMNLTGRDDDRLFKGAFEGEIGGMSAE